MTNRNAITKNFYTSDPFAVQRAMAKRLFGFDPFTPWGNAFAAMPANADDTLQYQDTITQHRERTEDGEDFTIYTKGDYPKLRIMKTFDEDKQLSGLDIFAATPGVLEDEVSVDVLGQEITIEISPKGKIEQANVIMNELPNRYSRVTIGINGPFNMEDVKASFETSGMLHIFVPAVPKPKSKRLPIGKT